MTTEAEKELLLRVAASIDGDMDDRLNNSFVRADGLVTRLFVGPITVAEARTIARVLREAAEGPGLRNALERLVEEFHGSIEQYDKIGPDFTRKDGTELFHASVLLDRRDLLDEASAILATLPAPPSETTR